MIELRQKIVVEWSHCDPAQIIFNPNYYIWMDQGTHHLLRLAGFDYRAAVKTTGFRGCPLVASKCDFHSPARFWDVLELRSQISKLGTRSFTVSHEFHLPGGLAASGQEVRVWGWDHPEDPDGLAAVNIPDEVRSLLDVEKTLAFEESHKEFGE